MKKLRERLAEFDERAREIFDALGDRAWPDAHILEKVDCLREAIDLVLLDVGRLVPDLEALEEEE